MRHLLPSDSGHSLGFRVYVLSGLGHTTYVLAVYASPRDIAATGRKTRFRLVAILFRAGLATRREPL